jgi:hypothetical protein
MLYAIEKIEREIKHYENQILNQVIENWEQFQEIKNRIFGLKLAIELIKEASSEEEFMDDEDGA